MIFEIKHRHTGEILFSLECESLKLCVEAAMKAKTNLSYSDLSYSNLSGSDLSCSNLSCSNLRGSNLRGSDLRGSDLSGSEGCNPWRTDTLRLLLDQAGPIRAYKLVTQNGNGPCNGSITYEIGREYSVINADCDESVPCSRGINLADLPWCCREWRKGYRILVAEFQREDIAAIPHGTDGKFRCRRVKIVDEVDLKKIGLISEENNEHH